MLVIFHKSAGADILLTQTQLDAITPVLNQMMNRRFPKKQFNQRCEEAMIAAGCPIDPDKQLDATTVSLLDDLPPLSAGYEFVLEPDSDEPPAPEQTSAIPDNPGSAERMFEDRPDDHRGGFLSLFIKDGDAKHDTALAYHSREEFEATRPEMTEYLARRQREQSANIPKMKG